MDGYFNFKFNCKLCNMLKLYVIINFKPGDVYSWWQMSQRVQTGSQCMLYSSFSIPFKAQFRNCSKLSVVLLEKFVRSWQYLVNFSRCSSAAEIAVVKGINGSFKLQTGMGQLTPYMLYPPTEMKDYHQRLKLQCKGYKLCYNSNWSCVTFQNSTKQ